MSHMELGRYKYSKLANYLRLLTETENKQRGKQKQNTHTKKVTNLLEERDL